MKLFNLYASGIIILLSFFFHANATSLELTDSIKRKAELERIISWLPADVVKRGRVSFLDRTFGDWLARTGELPPDFDKLPSIPFLPDPLILDEGRDNIPITDLKQWVIQRDRMKEKLSYYISGSFPPPPENLQYKLVKETKDGEITIHTVELNFGPQNRAKLTIKLMIPPGKGPFPVFLTNWNHNEWAYIAVRRGYIGCIYAGADAKDDTEDYSEIWRGEYDFTRLMRRAYGASRAVDYLYTLPYVDKDKIAITGHSRNGKTSLMAAAFDERIGACISSSGGTGAEVPWRYNDHKYDVEDIALLSTQQPSWLHPRLRFFIGREHKLPVDQNLFMSLIAPRGLMLSTAVTEGASNIFGIEQAFHSSKKIFNFLGAEDNIAISSRYGLHGVSAKDIEEYIDFFDFVFNRSNLKPENRLYYNYSFDKWRDLSGEDIDPLDFEKKGHNLLLVDRSKTSLNLTNWLHKRSDILEQISWLLGDEPPGVTNKGPQTLEKGGVGERKIGTFLNRPITTDSMQIMAITPYDGFGESLFGYLYYPVNKMNEIKGKELPIIIYLHEYDYSKGFAAMSYDHELNSVFQKLTSMGFGVFSFDMIGFGNRLEEAFHFYDRYPSWSKMGKMVADVESAVDALTNLDFVDESKIFIAGYSLGGMVGIISTAVDERVAGVVSVAGFTPMRQNKLGRGTEGILTLSHMHGLLPRLGFFVGNEERIPVDFDEILATIAPRPVYIISPRFDRDANPDDIKRAVKRVENIYDLYKNKNNIQLYMPEDYNRFSESMRESMYKWFETKVK